MSLDFSHAYGDAPVCPRPSALFRWLLYAGAPFHPKFYLWANAARAWKQYDSFATISSESRLGPRAWCVNLSGDRNRIILEGRVFCRGLLRLENVENSCIKIHPEVYLGDDTLLSCSNRIEIGSYTLLAHGVQVFDNNSHPVDWQERMNDWQRRIAGDGEIKSIIPSAPVMIGEHVWVGANSMIFKGVTIGEKSVIAAGSIVTTDVPANTLVAGNPARLIRNL